MNAAGILFAINQGYPLQIVPALLGQAMITTIQLFAQYTNEYYDVEVDRIGSANRTWFTGGSGVLPSGLVEPSRIRQVLRIFLVLGILLTLLSASLTSALPVLVIGALSLLGSWFYSAPPLDLKGSGLGELEASLIVTFLVPALGYVMQTGLVDIRLFLFCLPLLLIHWGMIIAFSFPDIEADASGGKRTLAVRFGLQKTAIFHNTLLLVGYLLFWWIRKPYLPVSRSELVAWTIPLAVLQMVQIMAYAQGRWRRHHLLTLTALSLFALTALLWTFELFIIR